MIELNLDRISPKLQRFCRENRIQRLAVFGSALRDDFGENSDLDLLVEFQPDTHIGLRFFALERELSELFSRKVELNTPAFLSRYFRDEVMREARDLYVAA